MNTPKSWFEKARAQTLKNKNERENRPGSDTGNTTSNTSSINQNGQASQKAAPTVEKSLAEFLHKPATGRGLPAMTPDVVNAYNIDWWELEPFLKRTYPGIPFKENLAVEDHYLIYVPRPLTGEEREKINELRKQHRVRESQSRTRLEHSPDGPRRPIVDDD
ncbi:hypothetical protein GGS24DRAFT_212491 [Hypoxylon argillaceum]|nr:hypothetical protein GGS24DRAFT_212491 [Hypoxylon argillaceum]